MSAILFQVLRFILPISNLFTPILRHMVNIVSRLETSSTARVSYYRETRLFVDWLREEKGFNELEVTGHSLGGGLAIITGAGTFAVVLNKITVPIPVLSNARNNVSYRVWHPCYSDVRSKCNAIAGYFRRH